MLLLVLADPVSIHVGFTPKNPTPVHPKSHSRSHCMVGHVGMGYGPGATKDQSGAQALRFVGKCRKLGLVECFE